MTIEDLAAYLQVSKSSLYKLAQRSEIPGHKVGKHWRFRRSTIDRWLDRGDAGSAMKRRSHADA
ncbi:MAG: helix-turn-helix domain-containing protein [Phycisphaerales bacterium]